VIGRLKFRLEWLDGWCPEPLSPSAGCRLILRLDS
jgi:hypothetical protein